MVTVQVCVLTCVCKALTEACLSCTACGSVKGCAFMVSVVVRGGPGLGCVDLGKPFFLLQLVQVFRSPSQSMMQEDVAVMLYTMPHLILQSRMWVICAP